MLGVNKETDSWFTKYRLIMYLFVILVAGYISYKLILSDRISELINAHRENKLERSLLDSEMEKLNRINVLTASYRFYKDELAKLRDSVFKEEETLNFLRMLPQIAHATGNTLSSLVPKDPIDPNLKSDKQVKSGEQVKANVKQDSSAMYKLRPIEIVIKGKYANVAKFLDSLEKLQKRLIIGKIDISPESEDETTVEASITLKLVQMDIEPVVPEEEVPVDRISSTPGIQVVKYDQKGQAKDAQSPSPKVEGTVPKHLDRTNASKPTVISQAKKDQPVDAHISRPQGTINPLKAQRPATKPATPVKPFKDVPKTTSDFQYTVQVGAFIYKENAEKLLRLVNSHGFDGWMRQAQHSGRQMHFVYVGKYRTLNEARQVGRDMQNKISDVKYYYLVKTVRGNGKPGPVVFHILK